MTVAQIKIHLETINHSKESRKANVQMVVANPQMISTLLKTAQNVNEQISCKALWLLEFVCREDLKQITPFLDEFIETIQLVKLESAKRPSAKICEYLIENYYCKSQLLEVYSLLNVRIRSKIAEQCFDWLIDEKTKVATKAYSMTSLFLLGTEFSWIHSELQLHLEKNYNASSAAYKARSRIVFEKIKKTQIK